MTEIVYISGRTRLGHWRVCDFFGGVIVGAGFNSRGNYVRIIPWRAFDFAISGLTA